MSGAVQEIQARAHDVGARKKNFAVFSISQVRDPIKWLVRAENVGVINPIILIDAADEVLQRHNNPIDCLPSAAIGPPWGSASQLYLYLRKKIRSNAQVNATDVEMVLAWLHSRPLDFHVRKRLLKVVLLLAMRGCLSRQLDRLLEHEVVEFEEMSLKHRFQVLRCYAYNGHWDKVSTRLEVMKAMATPFESLKLRNLEYLSGWIEGGWDHLEAERQFLALAPAGVAREFKSDVTPLYDAIRDRMRFMDIRSEGDNRSSLLSRIGQAIDSKEAFSCVRLGDREGYLFTECGYFSPGDVVACERHWWGERLEVAQRSKIVKEAKEAVANADLVGIPSIQRFIRDVSLKTDSLQDTLQFRGLVSVLMGIPSVVGASTMFTETYVNTGLFGDLGTISALARRADRLIIVASVKRERVPAILRAHGDFCYVTLPTHKNTDDSESYNKGDKKLPEVYERVIEDVEGVAKPGSLVLVAGGVIGKILVDRARAKGAVVIDLGHVIDEWIRGGGGNLR
ncbi:hypothetical protein TVD_05140 [Thioalkalivibrio versutus]|uniref:Uncharacterized protein n=1 Tax=Thioalkalivibrio versutus TaxID=106634 RepID=A0A0G3G0R9_9GAMM|nr:hypothetical protein TVD_05140 [Thioalkalivibrio versutus]